MQALFLTDFSLGHTGAPMGGSGMSPLRGKGSERGSWHGTILFVSIDRGMQAMLSRHAGRMPHPPPKAGFQRRNRETTSDAPGIGLGEMRLSLALKAAADLPGFFLRAGTSLNQGLPPWVTMTVSPACAKSPIMSNPGR